MTKLSLILIIFINSFTFAQNPKLEFAKSYFEAGKYEDAGRIFKELYDTDNNNMDYFSGLVQSYNYLNRHKELVPIVEKNLKNNYHFLLDVFLGELYLKVEGIDKAVTHWNKILNDNKDKHEVYISVSEAMTSNRLFDESIIVVENARKKFKLSTFDDRLVKLYITKSDYKKGSELVIDILNVDRDLIKAEGHIYAFMNSKESKDYLKNYLLSQSDKNPNNIYIQELIAWYFRTTDDLASAFEVYLRLDKLKNTNGREILNFADLSRKDGYYKEALNAYEIIIDNKEYERYKRNAIYGYALALEDQLKGNDKVSKEQAETILKRYKELISLNNNSNEAIDAMFRIAIIKKKWLNDYESSNNDLRNLMNNYSRYPIASEAGLQLGLNYMELGQIEKSREILLEVYEYHIRNNKNLESIVEYNLANSFYFLGSIDSSRSLYERLTANEKDDISNDALEKIFIIDENQEFPDALKLYAKAEYELFKNNLEDAKLIFRSIYKNYKTTKISERSAYNYASILFNEKKYKEVIQFIEDFRFNNANSIYSDKMLILLADSYYLSGDNDKAIEKLKEILIDYSNSIYIQEVRDKIKKYRSEI